MAVPTLHPERTDDPQLLRWLTGSVQLPTCPPQLMALIDEGVLVRAECGIGEVRTWLAANRSWAQDGPRVRSALFAALSAPRVDTDLSDADLLRRITEIVEREVAPTAASHGGSVTVCAVRDGVLTVEFNGACRGCAARGRTLDDLVSTAVRSHFPEIRAVRAAPARSTWLPLPMHGRSSRKNLL
ncbi:hypothetical protein B1R94_10075 [Mycolicibacterium litorale]|nr:hypothetical protein B1R94_10075 [Mycolicibacterium litorale]